MRGEECVGHVHRSERVDVDRELGIALEVGLPEVVVASNDAGIVHQHVDAAHFVEDGGGGVRHFAGIADVDDVAAQLARSGGGLGEVVERGVERRFVDVEQHHGGRAVGDGPLCEEPTHSLGCSRDEHVLPCDRFHGCSSEMPAADERAASAASRTRSKSSSVYGPLIPEIVASFIPCRSPRR